MGPRVCACVCVWVFMMQAGESMWPCSPAIRASRLISAGTVVVAIKKEGGRGGRRGDAKGDADSRAAL